MPAGKILVVDDEQIIRNLFSKILGREGYEVALAKDEDEALKLFTKGTFNLVMMDIKLPGSVNGVKLLKQFKQMDPDIEGVIMTGFASLESAIESLRNGVSDYLAKPFDKIDVVRVINRLVEKQKLRVENKRLQEETKRQRNELKRRVFELGVLYDVSQAISYTLDYKQLFEFIMVSLSKVIDYDISASFLFTGKGGNLVVKAARAVSKDFVEEIKKNVVEAFSLLADQTIREEDISVSLEDIPGPGKGEKVPARTESFFNVPLIIKDEVIGMLNVSSSRKDVFNPTSVKIIYTISYQAAIAIERLRSIIATEKSKMESMVESMIEGVVMIDEQGGMVALNPQARQMLGFGLDKEVGISALSNLDKIFHECQDKKRLVTKEILIPQEKSVLQCNVSPVKGDEKGKIIGMVAILRDITKEKEVDRMKTEFISTVSHELRTPLTTIKEFVSILLDEIPGNINKDQKEYLTIVKGNTDRLVRLIVNLLDISRIETGRVKLKRVLMNPATLVKDVMPSMGVEANKKKIKIETSFEPTLPDLYIDPDGITQVFTNLIGNAIKFTPEGGRITVELKNGEKEVVASVADTGIGISPENLDKVFDRFQQIGRVDGSGAKGTGLGLSISKALVEMHKGRLWAESEPGEGSKFIFTLPMFKV